MRISDWSSDVCSSDLDTGAPGANRPDVSFQAPGTSGMSRPSRVGLDPNLTYVDMRSQAYTSFKSWVDNAVNGNRGYGFAASEAAIMFQLTANQHYCPLAVTMVDRRPEERRVGKECVQMGRDRG